MKNRASQKGLSLTEIMIAVAIAGILASLGYSNYQHFRRKAKQAEAKSLLGNLFTQMTNFNAEWGGYWGRFKDVPFAPVGVQTYNVGFNMPEGPLPPVNPISAIQFDPTAPVNPSTAGEINSRAACGSDIDNCDATTTPVLSLAGACTWDNVSFTACAEGDIGGALTDRWIIDHLKALQNERSGLL